MKDFLVEQGIFIWGILLFLLLSIGCQLLTAFYLIQMLKESQSLEEGNPKLLRSWLEHFLKEESQITNIAIFVDKSIHNFRIWKFTFLQMKHAAGQLLLLAVFLAGIGACKGIVDGKTLGQILPFYIICLLGLYIHFSLSGFIDMEEKKKIIKTNLIDFLENHKPYLCQDINVSKEAENVESSFSSFGEEEEQELKELLREILA